MNLTTILAYANVLTEDGFTTLAEAIEYMNEAQDIIARFDPIQAEPLEYDISGVDVWLPSDLLRIAKVTLDDEPYTFKEAPWAGKVTVPEGTTGTLKFWYYALPAVLLATAPAQIPEVSECYHRAIASYSAKMYYLVDDDPELKAAFRTEFNESLAMMKTDPSAGFVRNYYNL